MFLSTNIINGFVFLIGLFVVSDGVHKQEPTWDTGHSRLNRIAQLFRQGDVSDRYKRESFHDNLLSENVQGSIENISVSSSLGQTLNESYTTDQNIPSASFGTAYSNSTSTYLDTHTDSTMSDSGTTTIIIPVTSREPRDSTEPASVVTTLAETTVMRTTSSEVNGHNSSGQQTTFKPNESTEWITSPEPINSVKPTTTSEPKLEPVTNSELTTEQETPSEPISKPETTSEPKSGPETKSEPKSEPETTSEQKSVPTITSEPKSEPQTTSEPDSKPETTSELKSEPETTSGPKSEPETTSEPKSEPETTSLPKSEPETTFEPKSEPETTSEPKSEPETTSLPKSEPETTFEPKSEPETTSKPKSDPATTSDPKSEPETSSEPKSEPVTTSEQKSEPETTSEPKSEPEATSEPKSEPETTSEPKSEPVTTSQPKSEPETTSDPKSEPETTSEPKSEPVTTSEPKSEPETTSEPKSEPETTSVPKSEPETTSEPKSEPETTSEPKSEPVTTSEPKSEPETTSEPKSEPETTSEPKSEPETTSEPKSEPETTSEPKSEPVTTSEPKSEPETTSEPKSEPETTSEPKSEPETTSEPKSEPETTSVPKSEPETTSEPKSEPETTSEPKSEPETTSEPKSEPETTSEPKSEPETTSEPKSEPETTSEPKSEPETTSEPKSEPETTSEPKSKPEFEPSFPEPVPDWGRAMQEYQWGWDFLVYLFGILFLLLGIYSILNIIRLWRIDHLLSRNYFVTLSVLVSMKCFMRGLYLIIDAHNKNGTFNEILNYFLYSTAFPFLTSAFSILFYALLLATRVRVLSTRIQKLSLLIGIIVFHFALSVITDVVVGIFFNARVLLLVCQFFYVVWGTILFIGYFYIFNKLRKAAVYRTRPSTYQGNSAASNDNKTNSSTSKKSKNQYTLSTSVKITFVAAIFGLVCVILEVYGIFGVYRLYTVGRIPDPWPYFSYQFLFRLVEFCMCCLMMYVASQPVMVRKRNKSSTISNIYQSLKCYFCVPHDEKISDPELTSVANSNAIVMSNTSDNFGKKKTVVNFDVEEKEKSGKLTKQHSHLVIKDGLVRFKAEDDSVTDSEIGTSLPDLVHGAIIQEKIDSICDNDTGVKNEGYRENENDISVKKLHRCDTTPSDNLKHSMDFERMSVGTIGTFGTDLTRPLSSINLTNSLEWEFEQAYERSFAQESGSTRSLPSDLSANSTIDSKLRLLSDTSPPLRHKESVSVLFYDESGSPSNKPLIRDSDVSSITKTVDGVLQTVL